MMKRQVSRLVFVAFATLQALVTFGQELPPPKPKQEPPSSKRTAPKASPDSTVVPPSVLVSADMDCNVSIDGKEIGALKAGGALAVHVVLGDHLVQAKGTDGQHLWQKAISVEKPVQVLVYTD